jgi:Peptidase family M23
MNQSLPKLIAFTLVFITVFTVDLFGQSTIDCFLPLNIENRQSWDTVQLTPIGQFGALRKARPGIPSHHHTGIDFKRPGNNYEKEFIFPIMSGRIISLRDDGPFAQIIIEHNCENQLTVWSVYEHIAGVAVAVGDHVSPHRPIARFMNKNELEQYGWQFNHLHFEILKIRPRHLEPDEKTPFRFFGTYCLECYNRSDLEKYYYNPEDYFKLQWYHY